MAVGGGSGPVTAVDNIAGPVKRPGDCSRRRMISENWPGVSFSPLLMRPARSSASERRSDPLNVFVVGIVGSGGERYGQFPSGLKLLEPVKFPGIPKLEELLEELLLLLRKLGGGLEVYDYHQIAGGFAPQAG